MKKTIGILAVMAAVAALCGCNMMAGSGIVTDYSFDLEGFTSISASSTCDLYITEGSDYSIVISCDDNIYDYLSVRQQDGVLQIGLRPFTSYNHITFKAAVVMPSLDSVQLSEASSVDITGFNSGADLSLDIQGASDGKAVLGSIGSLNVSVRDASEIVLSASACESMVLNCESASDIDMSGSLLAANARITVADASKLQLYSSGAVTGTVTSASTLVCTGNPDTVGVMTDFTSSIHKY